jgi:hypothetical protein
MTERPAPYTRADLIDIAVKGLPFDPLRVIATYADPKNWDKVYKHGRNNWAWIGPVIVGYELGETALRRGST